MAKLDLYNQEWIDVIFTGRNQEYGAYQLRKDNSRMTNLAMFLGALFFTLIISAPLISRYIKGTGSNDRIVEIVPTDLTPIAPSAVDKLAPPPLKVVEPPQTRENQVKYPGGLSKFYLYIGKNYIYPASARESGVSGRIVMSFIVEKDGSLTDIKVLKDMGMGTGEAAIRLLEKTIKWRAGVQNGRAVRVQYTLPIMLNLEGQ
ncbi:Ferric siderophore transport system, periplasmic binding protein TonB [Arcticibacter svalbardensis MN12-7]|uniref:Ferric siderophore transport system, periplasmic binding protein TonB n=1 Tax=Arcticibacter svalbardensis MN12-7 TaxID=1150600 RepID=R9GQ30_9SPHI|nr:energy transducer TonB [Arcticibacter svalbardensis]EOR93818.1 Ferric siderophore transport system, periplasmic binding protein TonB [Arcticibacter svalbardensis MN12-7]